MQWLSIACFLGFVAAAFAQIPASDATKDTPLGLDITGNVYKLPSGSTIYHGTPNEFDKFLPPANSILKRMKHPRGMEHHDSPVWFGATRPTSLAMGAWRWCGGDGASLTKVAAAIAGDKWGDVKTEAADNNVATKLRYDRFPKIATVTTTADIHLILAKRAKTGHMDAFNDVVGFTNDEFKKIVSNGNLNGKGSDKGIKVMKTSGICGDKGKVKVKCTTATPPVCNKDGTGTEQQLYGWRAPWDQNELCICAEAMPSVTISKWEIITTQTLFDAMKTAFAKTDENKIKDPKDGDTQAYLKKWLDAYNNLCSDSGPCAARSNDIDGGAAFDIPFKNNGGSGCTTIDVPSSFVEVGSTTRSRLDKSLNPYYRR